MIINVVIAAPLVPWPTPPAPRGHSRPGMRWAARGVGPWRSGWAERATPVAWMAPSPKARDRTRAVTSTSRPLMVPLERRHKIAPGVFCHGRPTRADTTASDAAWSVGLLRDDFGFEADAVFQPARVVSIATGIGVA